MDEKRICSLCKIEKPIEEMAKDPRRKYGRGSWCILCRRDKANSGYKNNIALERLKKQFYNRKAAGISEKEHDVLSEKQNHLCALCFQPSNKRLDTDHDHSHHPENYLKSCRECIRGLLCNSCNRLLLPRLEKHPHLQNEFVKSYLKQRPFIDSSNEVIDRIIKSESVVAP